MGAGLLLQVLAGSPFGGVPFIIHFSEAVGLTGFAVVGALIVSRHPRHPIGWIWLLFAFTYGLDHFFWGYAAYGTIAHPGSLPGAEAAVVWMYWTGRGTAGTLAMTLLLLTFPTGKPPTPAWRIVAWIALGQVVLQVILSILAPDPLGIYPFPLDLLGVSLPDSAALALLKRASTLLGLLCLLVALGSLIIRLWRSRGVERQQIKWFVYAASFLFPAFVLIVLGFPLQASLGSTLWLLPGPILGVLSTIGMAAAFAIAIFR